MYNAADQSWESQPIHMSRGTVDLGAQRIGEYAKQHELPYVLNIAHGGEPLLEEPDFFEYFASTYTRVIREATDGHTEPRFGVQTNLIRLSKEYLDVFKKWGFEVSASIDGNQKANDLHRLYANGKSSYPEVMRGWDLLKSGKYESLSNGILAVADLASDPLQDVYYPLRALEPPSFDVMWRHGTWDSPPPGLETHEKRLTAPYGNWTIPMATAYLRNPEHQNIPVRRFESVLNTLSGKSSRVASIGGAILTELVIETDGSIQGLDIEKTTISGGPDLGMHLKHNSVDDAVKAAESKLQRLGATTLAGICQTCEVKNACGGGFHANRWKDESYAHPSVYHYDLLALFTYFQYNAGAIVAEKKRRFSQGAAMFEGGYTR